MTSRDTSVMVRCVCGHPSFGAQQRSSHAAVCLKIQEQQFQIELHHVTITEEGMQALASADPVLTALMRQGEVTGLSISSHGTVDAVLS